MALCVVKFGGTSVATPSAIQHSAGKVASLVAQGDTVVVVVSAMAGETDRLIALTQPFASPDKRAYDTIVSTGEQVTTGLMTLALGQLGLRAEPLQGWQIPLITSSDFSKARIETLVPDKLKGLLQERIIPVVAGFQGVTPAGDITTLGRGGSDVTAVVLAAVLHADVCHLYKDVPGVLSGDPKLVENPSILDRIDIEEMFELSSQGAKVVHARAIEAAFVHKVPLKVLSTFDASSQGTEITRMPLEKQTVAGIVCNDHEVKIVLTAFPSSPRFTALFFEALANANIAVDMILLTGAEDLRSLQDLMFTIDVNDQAETLSIAKKMQRQIGFSDIIIQPRIAKVSVVGAGLRGHARAAQIVYETLSDLGMTLYGMITTELKMSLLVSSEYAPELVKTLHHNFGLENKEVKVDGKSSKISA
jgi:aspartate kinase